MPDAGIRVTWRCGAVNGYSANRHIATDKATLLGRGNSRFVNRTNSAGQLPEFKWDLCGAIAEQVVESSSAHRNRSRDQHEHGNDHNPRRIAI